jgi:hypothetical protein
VLEHFGNPRPLPNVLARTHTLRWLPREEPDKITASLLRWLSRSRKPLLPVRCASPTRSARSSLALSHTPLAAPFSSAAAEVAPKYEVQSVQLVCTWRFGAGFNDTCYIDKTSLYEQSLDGQANNIEDQTDLSWFISTGALPGCLALRPWRGRGAGVVRVCRGAAA